MTATEQKTVPLKRQPRFINLQTKLIVGFTLVFTIVFASTYYWFYTFARNEARFQIKEDLYHTIKGSTETGNLGDLIFEKKIDVINGDEMEQLIRNGAVNDSQAQDNPHTDDPLYWKELDVLCQIVRIEPRAKPYTYIPGDKPNELIFITSYGWCLEGATTDNYATFKQVIPFERVDANLAGVKQIVFQTKSGWCVYEDTTCTPEIYTDSYGSWVSAFAPIKNSEGKVVAVLGVDFTASYVQQVQQQILNNIYIAAGITYAILLLLVFLVAQTLTRPMAGLTRAADQIGEGNYDVGIKYLSELKISKQYPDEIETLQRVFNAMVDKVYQREQNLRKQVEQLQIQIDETKRQKQVSDIVDSEFFQSLHERAVDMRKKLKGKEE
jgi:hypothetical protein